jgi:hypothetical protein
LLWKRQRNAKKARPEMSSIVIPKYELPSPLSSPGFVGPSEEDNDFGMIRERKMGEGHVSELESRELSSQAELGSHGIRRKPVPELP